jgi:hypothetical protein
MESITTNEKLELFQVEELEKRFEMAGWFDTLIINGVCSGPQGQ